MTNQRRHHPDRRYHPQYGYEILLPSRIMRETLETIEQLTPHQRAWLTQVYRGLPRGYAELQEEYKEAREYLFRIGYVPASEEKAMPKRKTRRGRGSY